jgi:cysteine desulfurase
MIYFDNNATTIPPPIVGKEIQRWLGTGNPSNPNCPSHKMLKDAKEFLYDYMGLNPRVYDLIWTSGASESNALFIRSVVENYKMNHGIQPHVVISSIEHKSIMNLCEMLDSMGCITYSTVEADIYGQICPSDIEDVINHKTCLVSIMWANNEVGTINNIPAIAALCKRKRIPFHTDATQTFGKFDLNIAQPIDGVSMSFHKTYGLSGIGLLVCAKRMKIHSQIAGEQNGKLRGGTENVAGIASAIAGIKYMNASPGRVVKNAKLEELKNQLIVGVSNVSRGGWPLVSYEDMLTTRLIDNISPVELTILGASPFNSIPGLPNTVALAVVKHTGRRFCNVTLKKDLADMNVIVSIGSACSSGTKAPSHVLVAMQVPKIVQCGVIRISFSDQNQKYEVDTFIEKFKQCVRKQLGDI